MPVLKNEMGREDMHHPPAGGKPAFAASLARGERLF